MKIIIEVAMTSGKKHRIDREHKTVDIYSYNVYLLHFFVLQTKDRKCRQGSDKLYRRKAIFYRG